MTYQQRPARHWLRTLAAPLVVAAASASNAWAVGYSFSNGSAVQQLALHCC